MNSNPSADATFAAKPSRFARKFKLGVATLLILATASVSQAVFPTSATSFAASPDDVASSEFTVSLEEKTFYNKATGRRDAIPYPPDANPELRVVADIFPDAIRFGDPVYVAVYVKNTASKPLEILSNLDDKVNDPLCFSITSREIPDAEARCYFEKQTRGEDFLVPPRFTLAPGERRLWSRFVVEVPPLEDFDAPFYSALEKKIAQAPVSCDLNFNFEILTPATPGPQDVRKVQGRLPVLVERRPEKETATLRRWLAKTSEANLLPRVKGGFKVSWQDDLDTPDLPATSTSYLYFEGYPFSPWIFIRPGNRKPSTPNNPTTLAGWRRLETEFAPSTLRDEITLTRLQLEYYDASQGEKSDAALQGLLDWLQNRPEPQRLVLTDFLLSQRWYFNAAIKSKSFKRKNPLAEKNATLCSALTSDASPPPSFVRSSSNDVK
ncbi:MAG: hypothetical protein IJY15_09465 [Thermoguttaceae bacterium]|nr:hypothetical protein [Thermoguttaceae bacterium]